MIVLFHCPRCQQALKVEERLSGILGYCPKCSGTVLFPGERRLAPKGEAALPPADRIAQRQGWVDRLRLGLTGPWLVSLVFHALIVALLAVLTWQVAGRGAEPLYKVNILLDMGDEEGGLRYQGPRDLVLEKPAAPRRDLLSDLAKDRKPSELIEVGPAPGAPVMPLTDLKFDDQPAGGFVTRFMNVGARGESFVYIVDKSGSMWNERLETAKAELRNSVEMLKYAAKFDVIFYDSGPIREMPDNKLVNASRRNKSRLYQAMAQVTPGGGTRPMAAFRKAFELKPDVIFFLTDGQFESSVADRVRLMNRVHARDRTTVHTIGFIDNSGEKLLQRIAQENHGSYRFVNAAAANRLRTRHRPAQP